MGGDDLFADLGSLESAAGALNSPGLPGGQMTGNPSGMPTAGNPLMAHGGLWQQAPSPRRSSGSPVLWLGIGGGVVALLIVIGLIAAMFGGDSSSPDVAVLPDNAPVAEQTSSNAPSPAQPMPDFGPRETRTVPTEELSAPIEAPATPDVATPTQNRPSEPRPDLPQQRPWQDMGTAFSTRLSKPDPLKGVKLIGPDPVIIAGYSWMVELLPYVGEEERYKKFDFTKSWTDSSNLQLTGPVPAFLNPLDTRRAWVGWPYDGIGLTHFVGVSGIEESRNDVAALLPRSDPRAGMFGYDEIARPEQITDGTSQTLMLMGAGNLVAPWVQGGGATIRGLREPYFDELTGIGSRGLGETGSLVMFADGSVKSLSAKVAPKVLRSLATIRGGDAIDPSQLQDVLK